MDGKGIPRRTWGGAVNRWGQALVFLVMAPALSHGVNWAIERGSHLG